MTTRVLVTGAAGFIGGHLCDFLKKLGYWVRAVDWKEPQYRNSVACDEYDWDCDLRKCHRAECALRGIDEVYALAADMGGMGWISTNHYQILQNNLRINLNTAEAACHAGVQRLFYSSSACVYPERLQMEVGASCLVEADAWNGKPDTAYGIEKLVSEELYVRLTEETDIQVRIARFHNVFGPYGSWNDGREKAPAAMCRKAARAKLRQGALLRVHGNAGLSKEALAQLKSIVPSERLPTIEVWGDGEATRSFCYIDDCLEMMYRLMQSNCEQPMNIGTDRLVTVNELAIIAAHCAGFEPELVHVSGPQGVRGRNADLSLVRNVLGYEPQVSLEDGIQQLYSWVEKQI